MARKKFLIPIASAVAALLPVKAHALVNAPDVEKLPSDGDYSCLHSSKDNKQVVKQFTYTSRSEVHSLLLRRSSSGALYAGHMSHWSHSSHTSHRSGY